MHRGETGRYETTTVGGETVRAFVPARLPPEPALDLGVLQGPLEKALLALGRVDGLSTLSFLSIDTFQCAEAVSIFAKNP